MKKVIVIVGPTGSGKTGLSIEIAKKLNTEIINGDSVQIYQQLNIGAAKIKESEKQGIIHHMLDVCHPKNNYSVYHFQSDVRKIIDLINLPIIVGGTGLYIKAALYDYEFISEKRAATMEKQYGHLETEVLYEMLKLKDPNTKIDPKNKRRIIRSLEQISQGVLPSQLVNKNKPLYDSLILYLDIDKQILEQRLINRLENQLKEGFIEEVENLKNQEIYVNAIGYREIYAYLEGEKSLDETKKDIISASKRLAKKQKTWFKNQENPIFLNALSDTLTDDAMKHINEFLTQKDNTI